MDAVTLLAPPLLGAFIGYSTNYVAIRMLFRPLRPWRIMGLRVPMTPGVIPAKRAQLAENIGEMVGAHLLTSEDVSRALADQGFQQELAQLIETRLATILEKDLGPVASLVPNRFRSYFEVGVKILRWRFLKHLHNHLDSDQVAENLGRTIRQHLDDFLARDLGDCLSPESREHLTGMLQESLGRFLASPDVQEWVRSLVSEKIEGFVANDGCLDDLLPAGMVEPLLDRLAAETPGLLGKFAGLLAEPAMQERIAQAITDAIQKFTASLGPMAALIGNFVSPELIEQKIRGYLADKGEDIGAWLLDERVQRQVAALLRDKARQLLDTPVKSLLADVDPQQLAEARNWLADFVAEGLKSPATASSIGNLVEQGLAGQEQRPLADVAAQLFGTQGVEKARSWTTAELLAVVRSPKTKRMLDNLVVELVEQKLLADPIGRLSNFLPKEVQAGIGQYLLQQISGLLVREVPGLVDSLNIKQIVARKVNSLDLLRLEGLLLSIMEEQFKYINLFGGILGFVIGLFNLLFLLKTL